MKHFLWLAGCLAVLFSACSKNDNNDSYDAEKYFKADTAAISAYIKANNIQGVIKDSTGVFYKILAAGNGKDTITLTGIPTVTYKGYLLNGTVFDQATNTNFENKLKLKDLIPGWQIGLRKISKGGKVQLFIPSYWGYQDRAMEKIPANSVLIFDVHLIDFTAHQ